jgi:predicted DNA-binding transcriptional regulator AlpA
MNIITHDRMMPLSEVCRIASISRASVYRWQGHGLFPVIRKLGPKKIGIRESEFAAWLESRPVATLSVATIGA